MVRTFIASKEYISFELWIDGRVEVKALPNETFSIETIALLAEVHQSFIEWHLIKSHEENFVRIAARYFENKGYDVKEQGNNNLKPSPHI